MQTLVFLFFHAQKVLNVQIGTASVVVDIPVYDSSNKTRMRSADAKLGRVAKVQGTGEAIGDHDESLRGKNDERARKGRVGRNTLRITRGKMTASCWRS